MRAILISTLLASTVLAASAFAEPTATTPVAAGSVAMEVQVIQRGSYKPTPSEINDVAGVYKLNNGSVMHITQEHRKLFAEIDGTKTEIVPVAELSYASANNDLRMHFDQLPFATDVAVSMRK